LIFPVILKVAGVRMLGLATLRPTLEQYSCEFPDSLKDYIEKYPVDSVDEGFTIKPI